MELKKTTETVHQVDYSDFEEFVKSIYGGDYDFVSTEECGNDSSHQFSVSKDFIERFHKSEYHQKDMDRIRKGDYPGYCNGALFNTLFLDGHIEEGNYVVNVCW